jgi:hypothetical protein
MARVWKIAPGDHAENWELFRDSGCIGIGWLPQGNYDDFDSVDDVLSAFKKNHETGKGTGRGGAEMVLSFVKEIEEEDIVVANDAYNRAVGVGRIRSEYLPPKSPRNPIRNDESTHRHHVRLVDWLIKKPVDLPGKRFFVLRALTPLGAAKFDTVKQAYLKEYPHLKAVLEQLSADDGDDDKTTELVAAEEQALSEGVFDPKGLKDARKRIISSIVQRRGQPAFRKKLLAAYKGRCAITGCNVRGVLEAAHIIPYKGADTDHVGNGLLLRADLHTLFDLRLVAIDAATMCVLVSPKLADTCYEEFHGKKLLLPDHPANRPNPKVIKQHQKKSGLKTAHRR